MKPNSLEEFYTTFNSGTDVAPEALLPPDIQREVGHFNVFRVADLIAGYRHRPPMTFDRRAFYKISLIRGRSRVENADKVVDIARNGLWFATSRVPYRWRPQDLDQTGYFCIFTDEFLLPAKSGVVLEELPIFQPGAYPVLEVTDADYAAIEGIFQRMTLEINSTYAYKYDLLRTYLLELIHFGQKLQPAPALAHTPNAAARVTALFAELLERQFPLETPQQQLRLRTAKDYADHLAVHVNHLNRVLKETTGRTTTALIGSRVAQEAKILLKQTNWNISEIADSLGFADVAHFCNFFKRQTGLPPGAFRE
ncbi:helix-turn-helix domain-containing protein [Hymenobacter cellulosilyticus]|uniref:Helix-turn-helix transcriptional regulator n=1 Tax=Hymenobacter cellulosilyticus TaxID=2932248 RepID=A0A8T9QEY6_9BACT|nr:AraC family transcriptional regulator [Hymenobacter cellulosilyticus]UOQ74728.1 helix-turn-helix transcriptional regulator [Hymenobacter cellulosilyticus]